MDKPEFVDAHVHFYDMQHPELFYAHWQPDVVHPSLGTLPRKLAERNWLAEDFIEVSRSSNVTKAVHVQAAIGSDDPVKETEWLQEAADRTGFPQAIVAYADLRDLMLRPPWNATASTKTWAGSGTSLMETTWWSPISAGATRCSRSTTSLPA